MRRFFFACLPPPPLLIGTILSGRRSSSVPQLCTWKCSIPALHVFSSQSSIIHPDNADYVLNIHLKIPFVCTFCLRLCMVACVCVHVSNRGAETKEVSGWISPPHLWVPRELLDAPQVLLNCTWMPHHHHLRSRDTLTRLLEEDKACSINNSRRKALLIYLMWLNATEWADGSPTCQHGD